MRPGRSARPIHVLHVIPSLAVGGLELMTARVVAALPAPKWRHSVVGLMGPVEIADRFDESVAVHCMDAVGYDPALAWRLSGLIRRLRPDVIHARNQRPWLEASLGRSIARLRVPLIFSFHGLPHAGPMRLRWRVLMRLLAPGASRMFAVSVASRQVLAGAGLRHRRIRVIHNGVDTDVFQPGPGRRGRTRLIVGATGNLTRVKNHALVIRAVSELVDKGADLELRIAGEGPQRRRLTELIDSCGLTDRAHLPGRIADVAAFLRELDVFVLPSANEAHPNALLEAMACGLPCVASRVGGVPEIIESPDTGRLVPPGDVGAMARAVDQLCGDAELRLSIGGAARRHVVERFGLEAMLAEYAELYGTVGRGATDDASAAQKAVRGGPSVVMLGPLPPPAGGMAAVVDNLRGSSLARRCRLTVLNNAKTTPPGRRLSTGIAAQLKLAGLLAATIRRTGADLVHIHTCSGFTFFRDTLHAILSRFMGSRVLWHIHGGYFERFAESLGPGRAIISAALCLGSGVIVLSDQWLTRLGRLARRAAWYVLPNGVPLPPSGHRRAGRQCGFLFVGNLGRKKGTSDLIAASVRAAEAGAEFTVALAGGEGEPGRQRELSRRIAADGLDSRVRLLGIVTGGQKQRAFEEADAFVLPSHGEGLPVSMLEAMACGLPVICTAVGAIPEAVTDGVEGFLIAPEDVEALAEGMIRLAGDSQLRRRMGRAGRERVRRQFALDVMVDRLTAVYADILERRSP